MEKNWDDYPGLISTTPFAIEHFRQFSKLEDAIVDIGCGYGRICKILEDNGYINLTGVDSSSVLLDRAKKQLKCTRLIQSDALFIPVESNSFSHAIVFGVINCLIKKDDFEILVNEINRIVKDGGFVFVNDYTRNDSHYFDEKYEKWFEKYKLKRVFQAKSGISYRHYSITDMLIMFDPYFDLVWCERKQLLSLNHTHNVNGYSFILQKTIFKSRFR